MDTFVQSQSLHLLIITALFILVSVPPAKAQSNGSLPTNAELAKAENALRNALNYKPSERPGTSPSATIEVLQTGETGSPSAKVVSKSTDPNWDKAALEATESTKLPFASSQPLLIRFTVEDAPLSFAKSPMVVAPPEALIQTPMGKVRIEAQADKEGEIHFARVERSSGNSELDEACLVAVKAAKLAPRDSLPSGQVTYTAYIPFDFSFYKRPSPDLIYGPLTAERIRSMKCVEIAERTREFNANFSSTPFTEMPLFGITNNFLLSVSAPTLSAQSFNKALVHCINSPETIYLSNMQ